MEKTIASYQEEGIRLQLVEVKIEDIGSDGIPTDLTSIKYKIIKNRKVIKTLKILDNAKYWFLNTIRDNLYQTKLQL